MLDIQQRDFSPQILQATGIPRRLFPRLVEAGEQIGTLQNSAAAMLWLPVGIPVISAGRRYPVRPFWRWCRPKMNPCSFRYMGNFNGP